MPAQSLSRERYAVYSTDGFSDDAKSIKSNRSDSLTLREMDYVDLTCVKLDIANVHVNQSLSTSPSTSDKWQSYWSRRERCCCFCNFITTLTLIVLTIIVVLASKGFVNLNLTDSIRFEGANDKYHSSDVTHADSTSPCTTPKPTEPERCKDDICTRLSADILVKMNVSKDPCQDFYEYACGGFERSTQLSWNTPRKRTNPDIVLENYQDAISDKLSEDVKPTDGEEVKAIKRVFQSCLGFQRNTHIEVLGVIEDLGGFQFGDSKKSKDIDLTQLLTLTVLKYGVNALFDTHVLTSGKVGLTNQFSDSLLVDQMQSGFEPHRYRFLRPSDYIFRDEKKDALMLAYKRFIGEVVAHILGIDERGETDQTFEEMIDDLYHINVYINRVLYSEEAQDITEEMAKCKRTSIANDLQVHTPYNISWKSFFSTLFQNSEFKNKYTICFTSLTVSLNDVISSFSFLTLKRYIIFHALTESDLFHLLPRDMPVFMQSPWQLSALPIGRSEFSDDFCARQISRMFPMHYVIGNATIDGVNDALRHSFIDLISSVEEIIRDLYWMPIKQKHHLLTELSGLTMQLEWKAANEIFKSHVGKFGDDYFENMSEMITCNAMAFIRGEGRRFPTSEGSSIFFLRNKVLVEMPTSVYFLPLVYASSSADVWYGAVGTQIAQTISQLLDIDAMLRFLSEDKIDHRVALTIAFRLQCLLDEYNKYTVLQEDNNTYRLKGDLTKNANFKDSLALRSGYKAFMKNRKGHINISGLKLSEEQTFFLVYAQSMCEKANTRGVKQFYINTETSHHSPGRYRVLGTLSHFKKFADAFHCSADTEMNPANKCSLS